MYAFIQAAVQRARASLIVLVILWIGGISAFISMPKESNPDITVPFVYISVSHEGIAPEDAERLLIRPLEQELRSLEGLKEMTAVAAEGYGSITLEFQAGFDPDKALSDVREKVDTVKPELPEESDEPVVNEINVSQFPVLTLSLAGPFSEAQLVYMARELKRALESIPEVLSVDIGGDREDLLELVADPQVLEQYGISYAQLFSFISNNNRLVAAGNIDQGGGRLVVKVPGLLQELPDLLTMPVKSQNGEVITFGDIATVQRTFKAPDSLARVEGKPAVVLEVSKRAGANILEAIGKVRYVAGLASERMPEDVEITYIYDESGQIRDMLSDLLNNVAFAIVLVMIIVVGALGFRPALLVGLAIPGAFLAGLLVLQGLGFTLNIVVLFSLILVAGMLVDGAIVVAEYAERELDQGSPPRKAYILAANRMAWPIIASTATTLAVFLPLLFWPGIVGEFMSYLPATVITVLLASLFMALLFLPVMGAVFTRRRGGNRTDAGGTAADTRGSRLYRALLGTLVRSPYKTLGVFGLLLVICFMAYGRFNHGVEFFPEVEPESAQLLVKARGDLSVYEKDRWVQAVERKLLGFEEVESLYARTIGQPDGQLGEDVIGVITFQFIDWEERRPANRILDDMRSLLAEVPLRYEFRKQEDGPADGKPIKIRLSGDQASIIAGVNQLRNLLEELEGITDISDNRPLPGIEWRLEVNRELAARYDVDVTTVGNVVQLVTSGLKLADYRPEDADDEVDIRLRLPAEERALDNLIDQTVSTANGPVPIANFASLVAAPKTGSLRRVNGERALTLEADVMEGFQPDERLQAIRELLDERPIEGVELRFAGEDEDQKETMVFLANAFMTALLLMFLILVVQFNSLYQAVLVMSAIAFSTAGVLLGLLVTGRAFGIVMVGLGLIALAGIVVNNNIILIDTYNQVRKRVADPVQAAIETGLLRLRPVLLTAITTVLGLMPMVLGVNVDLLTPELGIGAPSTQWWTQLSSAIAGGLTFATFLTLLITPCLLVVGERLQIGHRLGRQQPAQAQ